MDLRSEIRDFLTSRRARITPQDVGLKVFGPRRVPGLRREEVAALAGLSVDYYNGWSAAGSAACRRAWLTHWPTRCGWTAPSGDRAQRTAPRQGRRAGKPPGRPGGG